MNGDTECPADLEMTAPKNQGEGRPPHSPPSPKSVQCEKGRGWKMVVLWGRVGMLRGAAMLRGCSDAVGCSDAAGRPMGWGVKGVGAAFALRTAHFGLAQRAQRSEHIWAELWPCCYLGPPGCQSCNELRAELGGGEESGGVGAMGGNGGSCRHLGGGLCHPPVPPLPPPVPPLLLCPTRGSAARVHCWVLRWI